jgi:hypothetical protein
MTQNMTGRETICKHFASKRAPADATLLMILLSACEAARAEGLTIAPGKPALAVRAGRWAVTFPRSVDAVGALLVGMPTRARGYDLETFFADAATILGITPALVHWVCDGFDDEEEPPTVADGFDPAVVEAYEVGATLRGRYCADDYDDVS